MGSLKWQAGSFSLSVINRKEGRIGQTLISSPLPALACSAASTLCRHASLSVPSLLFCQNTSCCLFIYFVLIMERIAFPEERQQMIRAPALILPAKLMPAFSAGKNSFFQKEATSAKWNPNSISLHFFLIFVIAERPTRWGNGGAHSAASQSPNPIYSFSQRDNYSP